MALFAFQDVSDLVLLFTEERKGLILRQQARWGINSGLIKVNLFKKVNLFTLSVLIILIFFINATSAETGIQVIPVSDYVTGRFDPSKHTDFINLKKSGIPCSSDMYLRKETVEALKYMLTAFKKDNPKIVITIQSATRNFYSQKIIWDEKFNGKRRINEIPDITKITDSLTRSMKILKYSSMPGTSRHHWGTDFDINILNNSYYENGEGKVVYQWLKNNALKFGFSQPYTEGRTEGYMEEKWHWSYIPLSKIFLTQWNEVYKNNSAQFIKPGIFAGSEKAGHLAPLYVNSINPACR